MKLLKKRKWQTIWSEWGYAKMQQFGRQYDIQAESVVQVKEKKDGTYKARAFVQAVNGEHLANVSLSYVRHSMPSERLEAELKHYGII